MGTEESRRNVLVCTSDRLAGRLLQLNLERQGYIVTCCFDRGDAMAFLEVLDLQLFGTSGPSCKLAVLDASVPGSDGYELLSWIRTHDISKDMWVAMVIPQLDGPNEWELKRHRPDRYLFKPFDPLTIFP